MMTPMRRIQTTVPAVGLLLLILLWVLADWQVKEYVLERKREAAQLALQHASRLSLEVGLRVHMVDGLLAFAENASTYEAVDRNFENFAVRLSQGREGVRAIVISPGGVNRWVYPRQGNELSIGHDLRNDARPEIRRDMSRAAEAGKLVLSGPYPLRQGGLGLVARYAYFRDGALAGFVAVALDMPVIMREAGIERIPAGMRVALRRDEHPAFLGSSSLFEASEEALIVPLDIPDGKWSLAMLPAEGWKAGSDAIRWRTFGIGLIAVFLFCLWCYRELLARSLLKKQLREKENERNSARRLYQGLIRGTQAVMLLIDPLDGRIVDASKGASDYYGWSLEKMRSMRVQEINMLSQAEVRLEMENARTGNRNYFRFRHRLSDGSIKNVEVLSSPVPSENQILLLNIVLDTSEKQQFEDEAARYASICAKLPYYVVELDGEGRLKYVNPAAVSEFYDLQGLGERHPFLQELRGSKKNGGVESWNREIWIGGRCYKQYIIRESGSEHLLVLGNDCTEMKKAKHGWMREQHLLEKRVGEEAGVLLAGIGQEIRSWSSTILGTAELFQDGMYGQVNEKQIRALRSMIDNSRLVQAMTEEMSDLTDSENGRLKLEKSRVSVQVLCRSAMRHLQETSALKALSTVIGVEPEDSMVEADERRLRQILTKMLTDVLRFASGEGRIELNVKVQPEERRMFFKITLQNAAVSEEKTGRASLGVHLARRLVELHHGEVMADMDMEGSVSREFWIPWQAEEKSGPPEIQPHLGADYPNPMNFSAQRKILIIDDNGLTREVIREYLRSKGYIALEASNAQEMMAKIDEADMIMLDMSLSGEEGMSVLNRARKHADSAMRALPVIAVSVMKGPGDREKCLAAGASECLRKPLDLEELDRILARQQEIFR